MGRRPMIAGNWKMNTTLEEAQRIASSVASGVYRGDVDVLLFPPFPWLTVVAEIASGGRSGVRVGAQTCSDQPGGAHTGEVAARMLQGVASAILTGHSERRQRLGETDEIVRTKLDRILEADLLPVLCCGEALDIRRAGEADAWVTRQLEAALGGRSSADIARVVVAYEPIWAIGTGVAATVDDAQAMAATIRTVVSRLSSDEVAASTRILYGGSVTAGNAAGLLALPDVDGALVGGASLKASEFLAIVAAAPVRV